MHVTFADATASDACILQSFSGNLAYRLEMSENWLAAFAAFPGEQLA